jgi:hypothetical protein
MLCGRKAKRIWKHGESLTRVISEATHVFLVEKREGNFTDVATSLCKKIHFTRTRHPDLWEGKWPYMLQIVDERVFNARPCKLCLPRCREMKVAETFMGE